MDGATTGFGNVAVSMGTGATPHPAHPDRTEHGDQVAGGAGANVAHTRHMLRRDVPEARLATLTIPS